MPDAPLRTRDPLRPILVALLLATGLILSMSDHADPDLWGHVRYGADILAARAIPATTTYSFTAPNHPWINHEWVSEIVFAAVARWGGGSALVALKIALGLGVFALLISVARRRGAGLLATCVGVLIAAVNLSPGWTVRPQIFSYAAFAVLIVLLDRALKQDGRNTEGRLRAEAIPSRAIWLIPFLFVVWVNVHAGFVAGLAVLFLYVSATSIERFVRRRPDAVRTAVLGGTVVVASVGATLCTPYGRSFVPWLLHAVTLHRPAISEWQPLALSDIQFVPFVALVALIAIAWIGSRKPRPLAHVTILATVAWQSYFHSRHIPFLALLAALWVPSHLQSLADRWSRSESAGPARERGLSPALRGATWAACAILAIAVGLRVRPPWVDKASFPVDAFVYMREHHLSGRLIVHFDWAQYALYAFGPETAVEFDGRYETAYPDAIADMHFDFILGDAGGRHVVGDPARVLEYGHPELVLLNREYSTPIQVMSRRTEWVLLYQDALAQLWGVRSKYDRATSPTYVTDQERSISDQQERGRVEWPAWEDADHALLGTAYKIL
jgi:hypothetical protein